MSPPLDEVRRELAAIDPALVLDRPRMLTDVIGLGIAQERFALLLVGSFAGLALALAAVGIYGVVSFAVGQRTREIAVRLALGARRASIRRLVLAGVLRVVAISVVVGGVAAALLARTGRALLYAVDPLDAATYAGAAAFLGLVALAAASLPAERASHVEPLTALRQE
jgi:ABC-type antimicrobial peptide transport system permease subunit